MVAIDADTGELKWYFQFTPHDLHDWDSVEIPILVDAPYEGKMRKLLVHADRNGFYYVLDRVSGEFLHGTPFIDKLNWATGLTAEGRPIRVPGVEPTLQGNFVCPSTSGATNWMSPRLQPGNGVVLISRPRKAAASATRPSRSFVPAAIPMPPPATLKRRKSPGRCLSAPWT